MKEITLKVKDIKEFIAAEFGSRIVGDGFAYKKTTNEFVRVQGDYTYIFNLLITSWSTSYSIKIRLWISQKQIEGIYEKILGKASELTFSQEMFERIYYSPDGRRSGKGDDLSIWLSKNDDLHNSVNVLYKYYIEIAKPYFERFKTLSSIDDFINNAPFEYSPAYVGSSTKIRCMYGLIVAKVVNNSNYEHLIKIYDELIKKTLSTVQPDSIINYNTVKDYLKNYEL